MRTENSAAITRNPSPLAGEGGRRSRTDEGSPTERDTENTDHVYNFTSHRPVKPIARAHARAMRVTATEAEKALLRLLRDQRLAEMKWRRQIPIGAFIVDFVCFEHRLIVECDGSQHADNRHDDKRDAWLWAQGFRVLRFWNHDVMGARLSVIDTILAQCGLPR
jgi:very-short-patch-repair endonuclease